MTTAAMSMTHPRTAPALERVTVALLLCFVASLQISIAAANILLALMMVCWVAQIAQEKAAPDSAAFFLAARRVCRRNARHLGLLPRSAHRASSTTSSSCCS